MVQQSPFLLLTHKTEGGSGFNCYNYYVLSLISRVQLCVTPWTVAHQAPLSMEFSRQESWSGLPFSSPGYLPDPGIEPAISHISCLPLEPSGKPYSYNYYTPLNTQIFNHSPQLSQNSN